MVNVISETVTLLSSFYFYITAISIVFFGTLFSLVVVFQKKTFQFGETFDLLKRINLISGLISISCFIASMFAFSLMLILTIVAMTAGLVCFIFTLLFVVYIIYSVNKKGNKKLYLRSIISLLVPFLISYYYIYQLLQVFFAIDLY
jgi:hypothetical protein